MSHDTPVAGSRRCAPTLHHAGGELSCSRSSILRQSADRQDVKLKPVAKVESRQSTLSGSFHAGEKVWSTVAGCLLLIGNAFAKPPVKGSACAIITSRSAGISIYSTVVEE